MTRTKLQRYQSLRDYPNVYEGLDRVPLDELFPKNQPLTLELACGRGEYSNGLGSLYPNRNFLGIDVKGERLWQAARRTRELRLKNVAFARTPIDLLERALPSGSVQDIWLTHPDPQPKRPRQRLVHEKYLQKYITLLPVGGVFRLKTDDSAFFEYARETLPAYFELEVMTRDLRNSPLQEEHRGITTNFERKALAQGRTINYLRAHRKAL